MEAGRGASACARGWGPHLTALQEERILEETGGHRLALWGKESYAPGGLPSSPGEGKGRQPRLTFEGRKLFWQVLFITVLLVTEKLL